jgi:Domain of unknown function (DUF5606)
MEMKPAQNSLKPQNFCFGSRFAFLFYLARPLKNRKLIMEYSKIIAVTGLPGLYELINSKNDGAIVRSLDDKSTKFVSSRIHHFSHLESIEIYTVKDNVNLVDILKAMDSSGEKLPDEKDAVGLKKYFEKVFGDLDFDRVYSSDLKKMLKWYAILKKNKIEFKLTEPTEEPIKEEKVVPPAPKSVVEEKPKAPKKPVEVKAEAPKKEDPKKKATEKVKEKPKEKAPAKPAAKDKPKEKAKEKPKVKAAAKVKPKKSAPKKK